MKYTIKWVCLSLFLISCEEPTEPTKLDIIKNYELVDDEGIYVEVFDTSVTSLNRYTDNNSVYTTGKSITYDYYYQDKLGYKFKFEQDENSLELDHRKAWKWISIDDISEKTIDKIELKVKYGLQPFINRNPNYNQTVISYFFPQVDGELKFNSSTGVIENEKNIWMHPPRNLFFRILEINPFPFIQAPYEIGNTWTWSLRIGESWGDERWKIWDGSIENQYKYEIVDKTQINLKAGKYECYIIESTAISAIGTSKLISYFNKDLGFIKLDYTNIDSTKTVLEMINYQDNDHDE